MSFSITTERLLPSTPHKSGRLSSSTVLGSLSYSKAHEASVNRASATSRVAIPPSFNNRNKTPVRTNYVVGQNNRTGEYISSDGAGNTLAAKYTGSTNPQVGYISAINRSPSTQGGRSVTFTSILPRTTVQPNTGATNGVDQNPDTTACGRLETETIINWPDPPSPPPDPDPDPPAPQPQPDNSNSPQGSNQPSRPSSGCDSGGNQQWFKGSSCPPGTSSRGFANLADGETWTLCEGPPGATPSGDGCPTEPEQYGYSPINGECQLVPNGLYGSKSECDQAQQDQQNPQDPPPQHAQPPFRGGQCPPSTGKLYRGFADTRLRRPPDAPSPTRLNFVGKPGPIRVTQLLERSGVSVTGRQLWRGLIQIIDGEGTVLTSSGFSNSPEILEMFAEVFNLSVTGGDEQDNCGDPPPLFPPPIPPE